MADNTVLNAGTGGDTVRDIDHSGVKTQVVALDLNPAGAETLMAGSMPVTAASLPLPTGAATSAKQDTGNTSIASVDTKIGEVQASPTANTLLDRLKVIATNVAALATTIVLGAGSAVIGVVNLALGGTALDGNSGTKSAQTLRVVIATDQPALTNKLLVTPDLPSGASTAAKQPALGTAGTASTDVISIQGIASMTKLLVTPDSVALPANQSVNVAQINGVTPLMGAGNTGTGSHRVTIATDQAAVAVTPAGNVAHDAVDSGNPIKIGMRALAHGTNPTAVAAADRTDWLANRAGVPWVIGGHPNIVTIAAAYTAAQTDTAIVTISSGLIIVVTQVMLTCSNANSVNVGAYVGFGTANTPTTTGVVLTHPGIAPGSGVSRGDGGGMLGFGADGSDLRITCDVPTGGSIRVLVSYYTIES